MRYGEIALLRRKCYEISIHLSRIKGLLPWDGSLKIILMWSNSVHVRGHVKRRWTRKTVAVHVSQSPDTQFFPIEQLMSTEDGY